MNRFSYRHILTLIAVVSLTAASVEAQTGGATVTVQGTVSETVALSAPPNATDSNVNVDVKSMGSTVRITLSGNDIKSPVIRVPLIVRSNSPFNIWAVVEATMGQLSQLSVIDVRAHGPLVSPQAVSELDIAPQFDLRGSGEIACAAKCSLPFDLARPFVILKGPRISLGGTLNSPNNALQMTLLIRMKPHPGQGWLIHLTFAGTANVF